jgi:hypothetical protein
VNKQTDLQEDIRNAENDLAKKWETHRTQV